MELDLKLECKGKKSWPELVRALGVKAVETIERENPYVHAVILLEGTPITSDFRCDRVHVFVNTEGFVVSVPFIG